MTGDLTDHAQYPVHYQPRLFQLDDDLIKMVEMLIVERDDPLGVPRHDDPTSRPLQQLVGQGSNHQSSTHVDHGLVHRLRPLEDLVEQFLSPVACGLGQ